MLSLATLVDGWIRGNWREASGQLGIGLEISRALGSPRFEAMAWFMRTLLTLRSGDLGLAREHLNTAFEVAGERGMFFSGPQLYGTLARLESDPVARRQALASGEAMLAGGSLSLNFFIFYEAAIQVSLDAGEWDEAERYCARLETYTAAEPFAWADFIVARGRALCRVGRGETGTGLAANLQALRKQGTDSESHLYVPDLEAALERLGAS